MIPETGYNLLFTFCMLFVASMMATFSQLLRKLQPLTSEKLSRKNGLTFYCRLHKLLFADFEKSLFFASSLITACCSLLYVLFALGTFAKLTNSYDALTIVSEFFVIALTLCLFVDLIPRYFGRGKPNHIQHISQKIAFFLLFLFLPLNASIYYILTLTKLDKLLFFKRKLASETKEKLVELLDEVDERALLLATDKQLFQSVLTFRERITREVMVPRTELFCIPASLSIRQASKLIEEQGYSRIPVYRNTIDEIIGILFAKDLLIQFVDGKSHLDASIETIIKKPLFTPETKKISQLLQEFRNKQMHIAIVVDEYGGTAGIVTIEDILEEIVGEIADEYDIAATLYRKIGKNSYIVDAKMNLLDLQEELGIVIPEVGEYDTIAGYIFYRLGLIPQTGTKIHHDLFEIEILSSNDRVVDKVKITTTSSKEETIP